MKLDKDEKVKISVNDAMGIFYKAFQSQEAKLNEALVDIKAKRDALKVDKKYFVEDKEGNLVDPYELEQKLGYDIRYNYQKNHNFTSEDSYIYEWSDDSGCGRERVTDYIYSERIFRNKEHAYEKYEKIKNGHSWFRSIRMKLLKKKHNEFAEHLEQQTRREESLPFYEAALNAMHARSDAYDKLSKSEEKIVEDILMPVFLKKAEILCRKQMLQIPAKRNSEYFGCHSVFPYSEKRYHYDDLIEGVGGVRGETIVKMINKAFDIVVESIENERHVAEENAKNKAIREVEEAD